MKVVETRDAFLSDYEVLQFLSKLERQHHWNEEPTTDPNSKKKAKKHGTYNHPELEFITKNAITYLGIDKNSMPQEEDDEDDEASGQQDQPPKDARSPLSRLNDDRFCELVRRLNAFELFKAEKLQLVNQLPHQHGPSLLHCRGMRLQIHRRPGRRRPSHNQELHIMYTTY